MRCRYLLTNVKFNDSYKDACYFPTVAARDAALIGSNLFSPDNINFNYGSIVSTSCVINEYNQQNYIIIKDDETDKKYFYFIDSVDYLSSNQWRLYLKMDVINQYMVGDAYKSIPPCLIERAHVDRFVKDGNNWRFNVSNDAEIIVPEFNFDYITEKRNKVNIKYCKDERVNKWLNENVACWRTYYIDSAHGFTFYQYGALSSSDPLKSSTYKGNFAKSFTYVDGNVVNDEYVTFCEPVYRHNGAKIIFSNSKWNVKVTWNGCNLFSNNNVNNYIYNIKYTTCCPLNFDNLLSDNVIIGNNLIISRTKTPIMPDEDDPNIIVYTADDEVQFRGFRFSGNIKMLLNYSMRQMDTDPYVYFPGVIGGFGSTEKHLQNVTVNERFSFTKGELKGKRKNMFEPKRLLDCKRITLRDSANGEYSYRLLYCATNSIPLLYSEMNNITNNNYYYRLGKTGIIPDANSENWQGVVNTCDYSQQIVNDSYDSYIANNKNFQTIRGIGYLTNVATSAASGSIAGLGNNLVNFALDELRLDNLKNAPNSLRNTNDTFALNLKVNKDSLSLYLDVETCRQIEEDKYINYLYNYGYKINKIDWITRYVDTRRYFNYIKCQIDTINSELPNEAELEIKRIFNNGVRLWNDYNNMYEYENENYEKIIDR